MYDEKIRALRMERQHLLTPANETEYDALYRDLQPGQNVYWNGFGQPPTLSFRADFDDLAYNKSRQFRRELIKGRFAGGNLGWILPEDLELFAALYRKPLKNATMTQQMLLERIEMSGPYTIGQLKEESGLQTDRPPLAAVKRLVVKTGWPDLSVADPLPNTVHSQR